MAKQISAADGIAVLDGDPFQPLWYKWIFSDLGFQDINSVIDFYAIAIKNQKIKFPDKYFILTIAENELRNRKNKDTSRSRSNFELHLKLIKPQLAYFVSMNEVYNGITEVMVANDPIQLADNIYSSKYYSDYDQLQLLKKRVDFINT